MITYTTEDVKMPVFPKRKTSAWIKSVAALHGKTVGDIAYIFCSDEKILDVNRMYLQHDYYTDIITFDYSEDNMISGAYDSELYRVIIHGVLHLCGIDDKAPGARAVMERYENEALQLLDTPAT